MHTPKQVPIKQSIVAVSCASPTANLNAVLDNPAAPVIWLKSNNHQGLSVENPQAVSGGDYYAFHYDINKGGFSLPANQVSTAHVKVENPIAAGIPDLGPTMNINSLIFPPNGSKDFVVKMENIKAENSNCTMFFKVSKLPGFSISYDTTAGQSNVNGGIGNNNDLWTFTEDAQYITVTSKGQISEMGYSYIGFKLTRNANTPAGSKQNLAVTIPLPGGGGETNTKNNQTITTLITN